MTRSGIPNIDPYMNALLEGKSAGLSVMSHRDGAIPPDVLDALARPHRTSFYFILFVISGSVTYAVDLEDWPVGAGEALFVKPWQVRTPPCTKGGAEFHKVTFGPEVLARLGGRHRFWLDPFGRPRVSLGPETAVRLASTFTSMRDAVEQGRPAVAWAYLNAVASEIEEAYFAGGSRGRPESLSDFLRFQELVDERYASHPSVGGMAKALGLSGTGLYQLSKEWTGLSPKEYLDHRVVLEAQRFLLYERLPVKELAARLGFSDENYFSRFFRRQTGASVSEFQAREIVQAK